MIFLYKGAYDGFMDKECVELCNIFNSLPSIKTLNSCSGHGKNIFSVFFSCTDWRSLSFIGRCIDRRYFKYGDNWEVILSNSDVNDSYAVFQLKSINTIVETEYRQIENLCETMTDHLNHKVYMNYFMKDTAGFFIKDE